LEKVNSLYAEIRAVLEKARSSAYRAVNLAMVQAYWQIGYLIVEHEQEGNERAEYGKAILKDLSRRLTREFGKGCSVQALRNMRQFYLVFSKRSAVRSESSGGIKPAVDKDRSQLHFAGTCICGLKYDIFFVSVHRAPHLLCCQALEVQGVYLHTLRLAFASPCKRLQFGRLR